MIRLDIPTRDKKSDRFAFYGSTKAAIECIEKHLCQESKSTTQSVESIKRDLARAKLNIEKVHIRVNKRTYLSDSQSSNARIKKLEEEIVSNKSKWAIGRTILTGAWFVFMLLIGWAYSITITRVDNYIEKIEAQEIKIRALNTLANKYSGNLIIDEKLREKQLDLNLELQKEVSYNKTKMTDLWQKINTVRRDLDNEIKRKK